MHPSIFSSASYQRLLPKFDEWYENVYDVSDTPKSINCATYREALYYWIEGAQFEEYTGVNNEHRAAWAAGFAYWMGLRDAPPSTNRKRDGRP